MDSGTRSSRPTARRAPTLALSLALAALLAGCGGGHGSDEQTPPDGTEPPPAAIVMRVEAIAFDATMTPLEGVQVAAVDGAASAATTGADGSAGFDVASRAPLVVRLSKPGYTDNFRRVAFASDSTATRITAMLRPRSAGQSLDATAGGRLSGRHGSTIDLPAGALVDAATGAAITGPVDIAMTPVDVSGDEFRAFPGSFSGIDSANQRQLLASYGTTEFSLSQGGRRLQLAPGQSATIELPIYTPLHTPGVAVAVGDTIPLWSLDETSGDWKQEGNGTVVASAASPTGLALRATVSHFSWWNCDIGIDRGKLDIDIETPDVDDEDKVPDDRPPDQLDNIDADPNHYRIGPARLVHIDARTADDSFLRQAGIDFAAAFDDRSYDQGARRTALRMQVQGSLYVVARGLLMPANRLVSVTACTQVKRGGPSFAIVDACGTTTVSVARDATVKATIKLAPGLVQNVPYILRQPQARTVDPGQSATFSVDAVNRASATGASLGYQWSRNGMPIPGATGATYTTPAATAADDGSLYGVLVSASAGTTISTRARLVVTTPPPPPPPPSAGDRWVDAAAGNDANAGTEAAPLRTISAALRQVPRGGTVWLLDGTWTAAIDPALARSSTGLNCTTVAAEPISTGTTIRAVHPGQATILYDAGIGICIGETQLRGLVLTGATVSGRTRDAAVFGVTPGASLLSGVTFATGAVSALAGAKITIEPAGVPNYSDPSGFSRIVLEALGAGSEIVVNGGVFDGVPNWSGASGNCQHVSMVAAGGARLVLNTVDVRSAGSRDPTGFAGNAIGACSGGRVELRNTTVSGFKRTNGTSSVNLGFAVLVEEGGSVLIDEGSTISDNGSGVAVAEGASVEILGDSTVQGSLGNGVTVFGNAATLRLGGGSVVRNNAGHGLEVSGNASTVAILDIAGASITGNAGTGMKVSANVDCRVRGTVITGNATGVVAGQTRTCDLGTAASPGGNAFANTGVNLKVDRATTVTAVGNTWTANQQGADGQGRYAVPNGQTVLEVTGPVTSGANYTLPSGARLRLAE